MELEPHPSARRGRRPFGLWPSPITAGRLARRLRLTDVQWAAGGSALLWHEEQAGHGTLALWRPGEVAVRRWLVEQPVRGRIGYGGGAFGAGPQEVVYVAGERLWQRHPAGGPARPITPPFGRLASPVVSPDGRWVLFVHDDGARQSLGAVATDGRQWPMRLAWQADFYMQPCWHPSGELVAWACWDDPWMPWEGARIELARLERVGDGLRVRQSRTLAGGPDQPAYQPAFSPDGRHIAFVQERDGWLNVHVCRVDDGQLVARAAEPAEHALPPWQQGMRSVAWSADGQRLYFVRNRQGWSELACLELPGGRVWTVAGLERYTLIEQPSAAAAPGPSDLLAFVAAAPWAAPRIVMAEVDPAAQRAVRVTEVCLADPDELEPEWFPRPQPVQWQGADDPPSVFGLYYPPTNPHWHWDGLPPAILRLHGGPTSQARAGAPSEVAFFTSRGYVVLEVNYRGSTGYGRRYRKALEGQWGLRDADDCASAAEFLVRQGLADPARLALAGASAGGFTALCALIRHPGRFRAAVCQYPVTDLLSLAEQTHRFERHYLDTLVGPLPDAADQYRQRSPLAHADRIDTPLAIFHGDQDAVVPKSHSDRLVERLRQRGVPCEYHVFEGEGHGWRQPETWERYLQAAEAFLRRHVALA